MSDVISGALQENTKVFSYFWKRVQKQEEDICWNWEGILDDNNYGIVKCNGVHVGAHRISYTIHKGPIPTGLSVLHKCDNPSCVNPNHLFAGTRKDNNKDRDSKNRQAKGERQGHAKLTKDIVLLLRKEFSEKDPKMGDYEKTAQKYNVTSESIRQAIIGYTWHHLNDLAPPIQPKKINPKVTSKERKYIQSLKGKNIFEIRKLTKRHPKTIRRILKEVT